MLTPREIVAEAWAITTKERSLWRWGFFAATFETLRSLELLLYQSYYMYWFVRGTTVGFFDAEVWLFQSLPMWLFGLTVLITVILLFVELFAPTFASGAVIGLAAKSYAKEPVKGGFILALYNFFPMLELHGMFLLSSGVVILTASSFIIRYAVTPDIRTLALSLLAFVSVVSIIFEFLSSFAEQGVVIRKQSVFDSIGRSFKLIISNVYHVFFVVLLLFVISIRIFVNAIVLLVLPIVLTGLAVFLMSFITTFLSILITTIVGLVILIAVSYFFAYLHVFKQTVWTITYIELEKNTDLDVINV